MSQTHTLTRHRDIQSWVVDRKGLPAIKRVPDAYGAVSSRLHIRFDAPRKASDAPSVDDGLSPVSWSAWLAELDRQGLALKVSDQTQFEFVERTNLN